jgi:1,4-dihydroxy-6-naphthoate synthase
VAAREVRFGYSPCPNDTFAFHALAEGLVSAPGFAVRPVLADVEELNRRALAGGLEMTKLSFHALGHVLERYALLRAGAALGRGCGPLVVARPGVRLEDLAGEEIAVPGRHTTAHLLWALRLGSSPRVRPMLFSEIMPRVAAGEIAAGLVIHEGRFTFQALGLDSLLDLGRWWEERTGLPIPLGCIAVRRDLGPRAAAALEAALAASVERAWERPGESREYVLAHAQEMEPAVVDQHIGLYVNRYTRSLGGEGLAAAARMLEMGREAGLLPPPAAPLTWTGAG